MGMRKLPLHWIWYCIIDTIVSPIITLVRPVFFREATGSFRDRLWRPSPSYTCTTIVCYDMKNELYFMNIARVWYLFTEIHAVPLTHRQTDLKYCRSSRGNRERQQPVRLYSPNTVYVWMCLLFLCTQRVAVDSTKSPLRSINSITACSLLPCTHCVRPVLVAHILFLPSFLYKYDDLFACPAWYL